MYYIHELGTVDSYWMLAETGLSLPQNMVLHESLSPNNRWLYLYAGWDSAWYLSILSEGYRFSSQSYAFFPGLTILGRLVEPFFGGPMFSTFVIVSILGVAWVPVYQTLAERRMSERNALISTILFALSPYVFLFTTVMYTEGPFLFFTLLAWLSFERREMGRAAIYASASTLIRPMGFLMAVPLMLYSVKEDRKFRNTALSLLPLVTLFAWFTYCRISTGNWLASMSTSEWNDMYTAYTWATRVVPEHGLGALSFPIQWLPQHPFSPFFILFFMAVTTFLLPGLIRMDRFAGVYSIIYYVSVTLIGTMFSYPRFFSFLFPVWMYGSGRLLEGRNGIGLCLVLVPMFYMATLLLWSGFISETFIA